MKIIYTLLLAAIAATSATASSTWNVIGTDYKVDTLFYNQVGPGTTQTSLKFTSAAGNQLRVFYATMDMTNPYLSLHGVVATDMLAGNERISAMAQRKSQPGRRYFVGVNADFFMTSGTASNGSSKVGSPVGSTVVDGVVYRARNNATNYKQVIVDPQGQIYINPFHFGGTITGPDGTTAQLGGINTYANEGAAGNANMVVIYNDRYWGSTNAKGTCNEVTAVAIDTFKTAGAFKMVVTCEPSSAGDMKIPDGAYVIHGDGTSASLIGSLHTGDTVTVNPSWTFNGMAVTPYNVISGNPKILADGVTLNSEADRGDANTQQPRAAVGYSDGGKKVYFFVVDGRSTISSGVRTTALADIMRYAGVTDAVNEDGGGSAILYTSTLGIRNVPSDGTERADGNGFYCVSSAPDDSVVSQIRYIDFSLQAPHYGIYAPKFYGYNKYGMLIDRDLKGVTLSCDPKLGTILGDTTFYANGSATSGNLVAHYGDVTCTMPIAITGNIDGISIALDSIVNDTYHPYTVEVQSTVGNHTMAINPAALSWTSSDERVVTVGHDTGVLQGVADGTAWVIGKVGDVVDSLKVIVEKPLAHVMAIDPNPDVTTWKFTQSGGKNATQQANGDGITYSYTGASSRAPKIVLTKALRLWSLPDTVRLRINPGEASFKNVVFGLRANGQNVAYHTVTPDSVTAGKEMVLDVPTSAWTDAANMANFPVTLNSIQLNMNASTTGKQYTIEFLGFETVYSAVPAAPAAKGDLNADGRVNMTDVTTLINMILGNTAPAAAADLNADGRVNLTDVTALIAIILGTE